MTIYQYRATITAASGSVSSSSLRVRGGICRQVFIKANTATTTFNTTITDDSSLEVMRYSAQTGEFNDITSFPMAGTYTVNITNASADDTFSVYFGVEE